MRRLKKNIAVLLFGIFVFPLTYQPYHVLRHHTQKSQCKQGCCHSNLKKSVENKGCNHGLEIIATSEKEEPCPICDYHFPINILPGVFFCQSINEVVESAITKLRIQLPFKQVVSLRSPRAPPSLKL